MFRLLTANLHEVDCLHFHLRMEECKWYHVYKTKRAFNKPFLYVLFVSRDQQVAIGPTGAIGLSAQGRVGLVSSLESESVFTLKEIASVWERRSNRDSVTATTVQVTP